MDTSQTAQAAPNSDGLPPRNLREIIRFLSNEEQLKALQVLLDLREHHQFTMYRDHPNEWWIYTDTLRKLRAHGVQFQWLTENV
jgi:hypothetical protein